AARACARPCAAERLADVGVEPVRLVGPARDVGAGGGQFAGLPLQVQVGSGQLEARRLRAERTSGPLWLKVRPSNSAAIRVRWMAGVPPAMAQPCASRCSRSIPNSSLYPLPPCSCIA